LLDEILPAASRYVGIAGLFSSSNVQQLSFQANWPTGAPPDEIVALFIDAVQIAGVKLAFSCIATMALEAGDDGEGGVLRWASRAIKGREIISVRNYSEDYEKFAERSRTETGIDTVIQGLRPGRLRMCRASFS
jgi:hypothetical protein